MLELAVLGLLKERPMYGYELRKQLDERLGRAFSFGTLYPTLNRLAREGAIEVEVASGGLRPRKAYRITAKGEALFERLIDEAGPQAAEDREAFQVRFAFSRYARPETRRRLLERRRGYLEEKLDKMKASLRNLRERVDAYSLELIRYGESETEREIHWLDLQLENEAQTARRAERKAFKASRKAAREGERTVRRAQRTTKDRTTTARGTTPRSKTTKTTPATAASIEPTTPAAGRA